MKCKDMPLWNKKGLFTYSYALCIMQGRIIFWHSSRNVIHAFFSNDKIFIVKCVIVKLVLFGAHHH